MAMSPEQAQTLAENYTAAWCSHDPVAVAAFFAENGSIAINSGEPSVGRVQIAAMAQGFYDEFPDLVVEMDAFRASSTHGIYLWTLKGRHVATGNPVRASGWESWRFSEDGLIAESLGNFDAEDYQRQIDGR